MVDAPAAKRTFRYRRLLTWVQWGLQLMLWPAVAAAVWYGLPWWLTLVLGVEALGLLWLYRRITSSVIEVDDQAVVLRRGRREVRIPLAEIEAFDVRSVRYTGGWLTVRGAGESIRLLVSLDGISLLTELLVDGARRAGARPSGGGEKLARFLRTAVVADHSWDRMQERWLAIVVLPLVGGVGVLFAARVVGVRVGVDLIVAGGFLIGVALTILVAEIVIIVETRRRLLEPTAPKRVPRPRAFERRVYGWAYGASVVVYAGAALGLGVLSIAG